MVQEAYKAETYEIESWTMGKSLDEPFIYTRSIMTNDSLVNAASIARSGSYKFNTHAILFALYKKVPTHESQLNTNVEWTDVLNTHLNAVYGMKDGKITNEAATIKREPVVQQVAPKLTNAVVQKDVDVTPTTEVVEPTAKKKKVK